MYRCVSHRTLIKIEAYCQKVLTGIQKTSKITKHPENRGSPANDLAECTLTVL